MKNVYKLFLLLLMTFLIADFSCNTTEVPPPDNGTLTLSLVETSCTEAWVNLKTNGVAFPVNVSFLADGNTIAQVTNLSNADTTVYIDSLLPNKSYQLQAQFAKDNQTTSSNKITVQTLDTTSNNFTWQTYTFGASNAGSSILNDVAIVNEYDIWAVGEIYMDDSNGNPDPQPYSLAHWDGKSWQLKKLFDLNNHIIPGISGIYYFGTSDIWLADGGVYHWDGASQKVDASFDRISLIGGTENGQSVNKLWGTSSSDLYGVGYNGMITHYNGSTWQKIESGTTTALNDIWGGSNSQSSDSIVLATVSSRYHLGDYKLLSVSPSSAKDYISWPYTRLYGVWLQNERNIFITGSGAYVYKNNSIENINLPTNAFLTRVRGNGLNDIYIAGCCNVLIHFNGSIWQLVNGVYGNYEGMSVKGNLVTVVGWTGSQAIIVMANRQ